MLDMSYQMAFLAGLFSFLSPCVLPLVPGYMGYLGSLGLQKTDQGGPSFRLVLTASIFVLGFVTVFVLLGISSSMLGGFIGKHMTSFQVAAGAIITVLGIHFLGLLPVSFLNKDARFHNLPRLTGPVGAYVTGLAFGFGWTPCVGPVLATILLIVASQPDNMSGLVMMTSYGIGLGLPFIFVALFFEAFRRHFSRFAKTTKYFKWLLGALLILTGIAMMFGWLNDLGFWMLRTGSLFGSVG